MKSEKHLFFAGFLSGLSAAEQRAVFQLEANDETVPVETRCMEQEAFEQEQIYSWQFFWVLDSPSSKWMNKEAGILPVIHIADIQFLDRSLVPQPKSRFQAHFLLMIGIFESISMALACICSRKYTRVCQCRPYHIAVAHLPRSPSWENHGFVFLRCIFPSEQGMS